jgi:hypothetical protein
MNAIGGDERQKSYNETSLVMSTKREVHQPYDVSCRRERKMFQTLWTQFFSLHTRELGLLAGSVLQVEPIKSSSCDLFQKDDLDFDVDSKRPRL